MFKFLCKIFGCGPEIYSAKIEQQQGLDDPSPLPDIPGWYVEKLSQTESYHIVHNMNLSDPDRQLHIVVTPQEHGTFALVSVNQSNSFTITTWGTGQDPTPKDSAFMFVAVRR